MTVLMILFSGIGTWILFSEQTNKMSIEFIMGAAFPMIFEKLVKGAVKTRPLGAVKPGTPISFQEVINRYLL